MKQNPAENVDRVAAVQSENDGETRNAAKEKWKAEYEQELLARLRLQHPETGRPVASMEELVVLLDGGEPEKSVDPELERLQVQLQQYRDQEEDQAMSRDAQLGEVYQRLRPEVQELARYTRDRGRGLKLKQAFYAVLLQNIGDLLQEAGARGQKQAMEELRANAQATPEALGGEAGEQKTDYKHMSDEEFGRMLEMALNGELRRNNL